MNKMNRNICSSILILVIGLAVAQSASADYAYLVELSGESFLPSTIYAGGLASFKVDVRNRAATVSIVDLNGKLDVGNHFEAVQLEDNINLINPGQTKTMIFRFKVKEDTLPGYYPALFTVTYLRESKPVEETQSITIPVSKIEKNIDVTIEPRVINPGKQTEMVFSLKNLGKSHVSNISFSWEEANDLVLPLGSDNKRYVSFIEAGEKADISYTVAADPNITPGIYPLNITVSFIDVNGLRTHSSQVGLIIGGGTDFEVNAEQLSTGQLSVTIVNIGSNNAEAVIVRLPQQDTATGGGSSIAILGNLNKGDYTIASFQLGSTAQRATQTTAGEGSTAQSTTQTTAREGFRRMPGAMQPGAEDGAGTQAGAAEGSEAMPQAGDWNRLSLQSSINIQIDYTDTTGERQTVQKKALLSGQAAPSTRGVNLGGTRQQQTGFFSQVSWGLMAGILAVAVLANRLKSGNRHWKKLALILAAVAGMLLSAVYFQILFLLT